MKRRDICQGTLSSAGWILGRQQSLTLKRGAVTASSICAAKLFESCRSIQEARFLCMENRMQIFLTQQSLSF